VLAQVEGVGQAGRGSRAVASNRRSAWAEGEREISPLQVVERPQTLNDPFHVRLNTQGAEASG
jgi:hypothetical protein